jgi:hypothetical protein
VVKTAVVGATLVIWLAVGLAVALLVFGDNGAAGPPNTGPYQIKTLVPAPGATFETTTTG